MTVSYDFALTVSEILKQLSPSAAHLNAGVILVATE